MGDMRPGATTAPSDILRPGRRLRERVGSAGRSAGCGRFADGRSRDVPIRTVPHRPTHRRPARQWPHRATKPHRRWKTRPDWHRTARLDPPRTTTRVDHHRASRADHHRTVGVDHYRATRADHHRTVRVDHHRVDHRRTCSTDRYRTLIRVPRRTLPVPHRTLILVPRRTSPDGLRTCKLDRQTTTQILLTGEPTDSSRLRRRVRRRAHHDGVASRHGRDRCRVASRRRGVA